MEILRIKDIRKMNQENLGTQIQFAVRKLNARRPTYNTFIADTIASGKVANQIQLAAVEAQTRRRTTEGNDLSKAAGAYFLNEDIFGGSRVSDVLAYSDIRNSDWQRGKIKLGPGISLIEAPKFYNTLKQIGQSNPELTINYNAPFGTFATRKGIKQMMDAKIDPEGDYFPDTGVYLTQGATEGIDLFMEMLSKNNPGSRVVFLGLSYYTGPYAAVQKGLTIERIIADTVTSTGKTRFFPSAKQIISTLPQDTKSLVLTMPNNPNGETYSDQELRKIIIIAKEKNLLVLFDCIFENMYFDETKNYQSRVLQIAQEVGALDTIIVVDSLSKSQNLPGPRIGFLATTNQETANALEDIVIGRRCNPDLTIEPIIQFEGLARQIKALQVRFSGTSIDRFIEEVMNQNNYPFNKTDFLQMYEEWDIWNSTVRQYYRDNLELVTLVMSNVLNAGSPNDAAFNTFVKLENVPEGTNSNDFLGKLMFTLATYTQSGACFGLSQKAWDKYLGLWVRVSYASSRKDLIEGLLRLIIFTEQYAEMDLGDPKKYPALDITYKEQI